MRFILFGIVILTLQACSPKHVDGNTNESDTLEKAIASNFQSIDGLIIQSKCLDCHREANAGNHYVDLSSYKKIMEANLFPPLLVPSKPEQSSFYTSIAEGRMPKKSTKFSAAIVEKIYNWIANGAKEIESGDDGGGNEPPLPPECDPDEPGCGDDDEWD